ncbi:MBL fold metallo-hydrolase [Paenibacillus sp. MBLB4367]|uniref:MBL fold metallo-hydrolase n=1 Tax=Paenibacillus sp. MBLB4367 TaxID=3384767 RepID=UPI0039080CCF
MKDRIFMVGSGSLGCKLTNEYDCNMYLLVGGSSAALIDSGAGIDPQAVIAQIRACGFDESLIEAIFLTHAHADHAGGAAELQRLTGASVYCPKETARVVREGDEEANGLRQARLDGIYPPDYRFEACPSAIAAADGASIAIGDVTLKFLASPGHSSDHASLYCPELRALFSGDAVFAGGKIAAIGTPDFSMEALASSIRKLAELNVMHLFPGHGSPVIGTGSKDVREAMEIFAGGGIPKSIV